MSLPLDGGLTLVILRTSSTISVSGEIFPTNQISHPHLREHSITVLAASCNIEAFVISRAATSREIFAISSISSVYPWRSADLLTNVAHWLSCSRLFFRHVTCRVLAILS
jgi:hypothetical protein